LQTLPGERPTQSAFVCDALGAEFQQQRIPEDQIRHTAGYMHKPIASGEVDVGLGRDRGAS
jgi:hypothetical protein